MRYLIISIILFLSVNSNCQSSIVSEKNGFKEFQFGDSLSKWILNLSGANSEGGYQYSGSCCQDFLDYKADKIYLYFEKQKLYKVLVFFPVPDYNNDGAIITDDIIKVFHTLDNFFGKSISSNAESGLIKGEWRTPKMNITYMFDNRGKDNPYAQFPKLGFSSGQYSSAISIVSLSYITELNQSKF